MRRLLQAIKLLISGQSRYSRCWMGFHHWSMPGGWCERCGICDTFFGGHQNCGRKCNFWLRERGEK